MIHFALTNGGRYDYETAPSGGQMIELNGMSGEQFVIRGTIDNIDITYMVTLLESDKNAHQLIAWALTTNFESQRDTLINVLNSYREK